MQNAEMSDALVKAVDPNLAGITFKTQLITVQQQRNDNRYLHN